MNWVCFADFNLIERDGPGLRVDLGGELKVNQFGMAAGFAPIVLRRNPPKYSSISVAKIPLGRLVVAS
jgi:hypothetical protein